MKHCIILIFFTTSLLGCKKFLDEKPNKAQVVPHTLQDLQALLDNTAVSNANYPYAIEIGSDDYYITTADWLARSLSERNAYIWESDVFNETPNNPWSVTYTIVYNSNVVLDELKRQANESADINALNIKGQALFFRSFAFYNLLQVFAKPYSSDSANMDWGIALRLDADLNKPTKRATVNESYQQLIADTKLSAGLLPVIPQFKTRPSRAAAFALLARTYLSMQDYPNALKYADSALLLNNTLIDYNSLNPSAAYPLVEFNAEVIFHSIFATTNTVNLLSKTDSVLYSSYNSDDLRKSIFFKANSDGSFSFKGSYEGSVVFFNGFATDELYLIKSECLARLGNINNAMDVLNTLMINRWKNGLFIPFTASDKNEALKSILLQRRKELLMRGLRWTDLRRLNKETLYAKTLVRMVNGQTYYLYPGDKKYVFPIPDLVIQMTGIQQNQR